VARSRRNKASERYEGDGESLSSNPFAALLGADEGPGEPTVEPVSDADPLEPAEDPLAATRLVVRKERKGRGGKTVTVVEGFECAGVGLDELAKTLKKSLGCSGRAVGETIELGGARQEQVATWLREAGAKRVIVGN
jgi:translation initiation factor 1